MRPIDDTVFAPGIVSHQNPFSMAFEPRLDVAHLHEVMELSAAIGEGGLSHLWGVRVPSCDHPRRLNGSSGEHSRCRKHDTTGDPYDNDNDGGSTLQYVNACTPDVAYGAPTPPDCTDDGGGGVNCIPLLNTLLPAASPLFTLCQ